MSDSAKENVVSLDDYGQMRRGLGNGPGTQALREIRDFASSRLKQQVADLQKQVEKSLQRLKTLLKRLWKLLTECYNLNVYWIIPF